MFNKRNQNAYMNNNRFGGPMGGFQQPQGGFGNFQMNQQMPDQQQMAQFQNQGSTFPQVSFDRLQFEIMENRRRINNLTKRIIRLENYLRIRDTSDYVNIDEDQMPNEFSM